MTGPAQMNPDTDYGQQVRWPSLAIDENSPIARADRLLQSSRCSSDARAPFSAVSHRRNEHGRIRSIAACRPLATFPWIETSRSNSPVNSFLVK
jgi:hypothetical protein